MLQVSQRAICSLSVISERTVAYASQWKFLWAVFSNDSWSASYVILCQQPVPKIWYWTVLTAKLQSKFFSKRLPNHSWIWVNSWHAMTVSTTIYVLQDKLLVFWSCPSIVLFASHLSYLFTFFMTLMILKNIPMVPSVTSFPSCLLFHKSSFLPFIIFDILL